MDIIVLLLRHEQSDQVSHIIYTILRRVCELSWCLDIRNESNHNNDYLRTIILLQPWQMVTLSLSVSPK